MIELKELEKLGDIINHYEGYNKGKRSKKLPTLTMDIIKELYAIDHWFNYYIKHGRGLYDRQTKNFKMAKFWADNKIDRITICSGKSKHHIDDEIIIATMGKSILPLLDDAKVPKLGAKRTNVSKVIELSKSPIQNLKKQSITNEYLWEFFKRFSHVPDFDSFNKTLQRGLKK
jgi:hypothetical protein